ncbi:MAG: GTPase [Hyphomicrobiaceae bacterium]
MASSAAEGLGLEEMLARAIEREFAANPPTIGVIGLSGVGKSSTINSMFGANRTVSATIRGTTRFDADTYEIVSSRVSGLSLSCRLRVYDAVGLGEDIELDASYLRRYRTHLPKCDIALWIVAARNRALALDQSYLQQLARVLPNLVIGLNQVDLVEPLNWSAAANLPSREQQAAIAEITEDRKRKLARYARQGEVAVIPYSALHYYNLQTLYLECVRAAPQPRRWMFDLIKSFSTADWLARAEGLTEAQRQAFVKARGGGEEAIDPGALAQRLGRGRR